MKKIPNKYVCSRIPSNSYETKLICESVMAFHKNLGYLPSMLDGKRFVLVANYICASSPPSSEILV